MDKKSSFLNLVPQKNDTTLAYRIFEKQAIVIDLARGILNTLNVTATRIWQLIDGNTSAKKIAEKVAQDFEIPFSEVVDDVIEILQNMSSRKWIVGFYYENIQAGMVNNKSTVLSSMRALLSCKWKKTVRASS